LRTLAFLVWTGSRPWFLPRLQIDGGSYLRGMISARSAGPLALGDLYHSPGYQIYLAVLDRFAGNDVGAIIAAKALSFMMLVACTFMTWRLGRARFSAGAAAAAPVLLAFSPAFAAYVCLLQYEVPLAFLLTAHLVLLRRAEREERFFAPAGVAAAAAAMVQVAYLPLAAFGALAAAANRGGGPRRRRVLAYLAPVVLIVGGWSAYQSARLGRFVLVTTGTDARFALGNNPRAVGVAFPYPSVIEPVGFAFIRDRPGRFLWLVGQRFLYLTDLKRDIWSIPIPFAGSAWGAAVPAVWLALFAAGCALILRRDLRTGRWTSRLPIYGTILCGFVPPLAVFGSSRFLLPLIPVIALFHGYALDGVVRALRRFHGR
jgi:hypothetical protein